ncbi:hypothetical protein CSC75_18050 [Pseudoxanthomonas wuyuanensis]|nr:hypothetical protein CSC75_18050 [Pseudoxanthomonas wuyuanensis]
MDWYFNACGTASPGSRIPSGGDHVINHIKAGDFVSATSPHFGQVRMYASADEIATLHTAGYANDRNPLDPRAGRGRGHACRLAQPVRASRSAHQKRGDRLRRL